MKINWRLSLVGSLILSSSLWFTSCSSTSSQQQEEIEQMDQQQGEESAEFEGEDENALVNNEMNDQEYNNNQSYDNEESFSQNESLDNTQNENAYALEGQNNDLENIVDEINNSASEEPIAEEFAEPEQVADTTTSSESTNLTSGELNSNYQDQTTNNEIAQTEPMEAPTSNAVETISSPAVAGGLPEMGAKMSYVVQKGDTLANIATKIYGEMSRWRELASLSNLTNPSLIYPGDLVYYQLDDKSLAFARSYENLPRSVVTVQEGDTLAKIASRVLGGSDNWRSIWRENDTVNDPAKLVAGDQIYYVSSTTLASLDNLHHKTASTLVVENTRNLKKSLTVKTKSNKIKNKYI